MSTDMNDVVIHVKEALDEPSRRQLEEHMRSIEGVISLGFNETRTHLMIVAYDPSMMRAKELIDHVRMRGYEAHHCGA